MTRNLLSEISSLKVYSDHGVFATADDVTIDLYPNGSGTIEPVTSNACVEIGTTGNFYFALSNITTPPTVLTEYHWIMADTTTKKQSGLITFGGWVESVEPLGAASTCKITANLSDGDGESGIDVVDLFANNNQNYMEIPTPSTNLGLYADSRYFKVGKYLPSYDRLTNQAFWVLPQGASINIKLPSFGIDQSGITVPASSTVTLNTLLTT